MKDVSIILPTYNEADNLPWLIPKICQVLTQADIDGEIIVVDDNSPDDTAASAEGLTADWPVRVIVRRDERGLATAVIRGFQSSQARIGVVMDADGSHPPAKLPEMIQPILCGQSKITVASRYIPGGAPGIDWPWYRYLISKVAASMAIGLTQMTDATTGFMAIDRELFLKLDLNPIGWKIVLETIVKAKPEEFIEVAIVFNDRRFGKSKMNLATQYRYLYHLYELYQYKFQSSFELLRFCLVGFTGIFMDMGIVVALKELLTLDVRISALFGFAAAVSSNYLLNRYWSFRQGRRTPIFASYLLFVAVCLLGLALRLATMHALIVYADMGGRYWYILTNFLGIVSATLVNFAGSKFLAFSAMMYPQITQRSTDERKNYR